MAVTANIFWVPSAILYVSSAILRSGNYFSPFCRWGTWDLREVCDLPKVTQNHFLIGPRCSHSWQRDFIAKLSFKNPRGSVLHGNRGSSKVDWLMGHSVFLYIQKRKKQRKKKGRKEGRKIHAWTLGVKNNRFQMKSYFFKNMPCVSLLKSDIMLIIGNFGGGKIEKCKTRIKITYSCITQKGQYFFNV